MARLVPLQTALLLLLVVTLPACALDNGLGINGPAMGWSSWNHFGGNGSHGNGRLGSQMLMEICDAMVASGLRDAGYSYVNLDDGWAVGRWPNGTIMYDNELFPDGIKPLADYIHSRGMLFGIYTARGSSTCMGRPGSDGHELLDAETYASWGVDYLKEDSCGGHTTGTVWEQYSRMRDALNSTGRPIYYSITGILDYDDRQPKMHCVPGGAFTVLPWVAEGRNPANLANSYLIEYCNNADDFGVTTGRSSFLSQLDSQQLLTYDNLTVPGGYSDMDMLEICNSGMCPGEGECPHSPPAATVAAKPTHPMQSHAEYRSQFSTFSILTSPLILGNDPRNMSKACLDIILNKEIIAINQDRLVSRAKLVYQWPDAQWPNGSWIPPSSIWPNTSAPPPPPVGWAQAVPTILIQVWAKPLYGGDVAVVAFNRGLHPAQVELRWPMLGLSNTAAAMVRDLWAHQDLGAFRASINVTVGSHDVFAARISPLKSSTETTPPTLDCRFVKTAPTATIVVSNECGADAKVRTCAAHDVNGTKYTHCVGLPGQPNEFDDCTQRIANSTEVALVIDTTRLYLVIDCPDWWGPTIDNWWTIEQPFPAKYTIPKPKKHTEHRISTEHKKAFTV